ncbi:MAG: HAD-IIIA family hydrolase [Planctomycetes bacterium]|nr:HAD-IIIA family hydrolase [Planctomycetota bacterium]
MQKPAVFLDRDGILNALVFDDACGVMGPPLDVEHVVLLRDAAELVRALNERGYLVLVVTSQPALAQGRLSVMKLDLIHGRLRMLLARAGARVDGFFFCPHDPRARYVPGASVRPELVTGCRCAKPSPVLILQAAGVHRVELRRSFMLCRDLRDVRAGRSATVDTILLTKGSMTDLEAPPELRPGHVAVDASAVVHVIDSLREAMMNE